jgi:hypothetical protein
VILVPVAEAAAETATKRLSNPVTGYANLRSCRFVNNSQGQPPKQILRRLKMDITAVKTSGAEATALEKNPKQHSSPVRSADKYADARKAKKKKRRAQHRAMIGCSHANG